MTPPRLTRSSDVAGYAAVLAGVLLLLLWLPAPARAEAVPASTLRPDVRLLIDSSASMKESDPENLLAPALALIVRLLPEGGRSGVWVFADTVEQQVPTGDVDAAWRQAAGEAVAAIDYSGQRTDIPAALAAAVPDLEGMDPAYRTSIVLLTDGQVDVAESPVANAAAARRVLTTAAPKLAAAGIPVHTIALSEEADWQFLRSLAQATGGIAEKAETPDALPSILLQALELVAPMPRLPLAHDRFQVDASVRAFTALVFSAGAGHPVAVVDPAGKRIRPGTGTTGGEWFRNGRVTLVTVSDPAPGTWRLEPRDSEVARVMVVAGLQLEADPLSNRLPAGRQEELRLRLRQDGQTLTDPDVLARFPIAVEVEGPRGNRVLIDVSASHPAPADGDYRVLLPIFENPGRYRVLARVSAGPVQRELPMYLEVESTPATSTIVTRGAKVEQQDLRLPLLGVALFLAMILLVVWWILRQRKRRRLQLWQRRGRPGPARPADGGQVQGMGTPADSRETRG